MAKKRAAKKVGGAIAAKEAGPAPEAEEKSGPGVETSAGNPSPPPLQIHVLQGAASFASPALLVVDAPEGVFVGKLGRLSAGEAEKMRALLAARDSGG